MKNLEHMIPTYLASNRRLGTDGELHSSSQEFAFVLLCLLKNDVSVGNKNI
jgi:hypothetical protein